MDYLSEIKKEFPKIRAHRENDLEWTNEAFNYVQEGNLEQAKKIFKKLCLSQPDHHDGFKGLAYIFCKEKNIEAAKWFISQAVKKAKDFLKEDSIDVEVVEEIIEIQKLIDEGKEISEYHP